MSDTIRNPHIFKVFCSDFFSVSTWDWTDSNTELLLRLLRVHLLKYTNIHVISLSSPRSFLINVIYSVRGSSTTRSTLVFDSSPVGSLLNPSYKVRISCRTRFSFLEPFKPLGFLPVTPVLRHSPFQLPPRPRCSGLWNVRFIPLDLK